MRATASFSARLAVAVGALGALAVGVGAGHLGVPVGVAGALAVGWGTAAVGSDRNRRRAAGSVALAFGGLATLVGVGALAGRGWAAGGLAVLAVAALSVDAGAGLEEGSLGPVLAALGSSIAALVGGVALASLLHVAFTVGVAWLVLGGAATLSVVTAYAALVSLQVLAVAAGALVGPVRRAVEEWFDGAVPVDAWDDFERLELSPRSVPAAYWLALVVQVVLAFVPWAHELVAWLLGATWLFGAATAAVLQSGVVHVVLAAVLALQLAVLAAEAVRRTAVSALSPNPPKSLGYAAGGVGLVVLAPVLTTAVALTGALPVVGATWGAAAGLLSLAVVALGAVFALGVGAVVLVGRAPLPDRTAGFALGAGLLFLAAVAAAGAGAPPLATFAGVAAALVAWDLGETAVDLGTHLGPAAETRRAEVVHATGSVAVGAVGVALAAAGVHLVGPLPVPASGRAALALTLALVALVAFALALEGAGAAE